jgi:hypothetical protein
VIALPFGWWLTGQQIDTKVVLGALAVVAGIVVFLSVGSPRGGTSHPSAQAWWTACLVILVLVLITARIGRTHQGATRALLFGSAAGLGFALQTAVTKEFVTVVGGGALALLSSWTIYVLIVSALAGFVLQQSALKTGVLAPAMASSNAVSLFGGVILGAFVYDEMLGSGNGHLLPAAAGLALAVLGVVLLARAEGPGDDEGAPGDTILSIAPSQ